MPQKSPVDVFKWVENTSQFNKDFIKTSNKHNDEGYFLEVQDNILKNYIIFTMIYSFWLKE